MTYLGHEKNTEYITKDQLVEWQSDSIERIAYLNVAYLGATVTVISILFALIQIVAYRSSNRRFREQERKLKSEIDKKTASVKAGVIEAILGPPRPGELVNIGSTTYQVTDQGLIGFSNEKALKDWGYEPSKVTFANPKESKLAQIGTINERKPGFNSPLEQVLAETKDKAPTQ